MPGLVVYILVTKGQEVKSGETVAIIEAMKMQNILKAERDGVVKAVGAKAGDPVAMARAMAGAIESGRAARAADPIEPRDMATPSTPVIGKAFLA